jgi:transposase
MTIEQPSNIEVLSAESEPLDDIPLLLGIIREMGIAARIDACVTPDKHWQGISVGTAMSIWLCYVLTSQDHGLVAVREWVAARQEVFNRVLGITLRDTDCSDDRLANILSMVGKGSTQRALDEALWADWLRVYRLPRETIRLDGTAVSVYHQRDENDDSLLQFGFNGEQSEPMRQFRVMMATLDPLGMPLTASVVSGEHGDDLLYIPTYQTAVKLLGSPDVLVVGDSKMSSLATRGQLVKGGSRYLCPLNENTLVKVQRLQFIDDAAQQPQAWQAVHRKDADGKALEQIAIVVERERAQAWMPAEGEPIEWSERVLVVRSEQLREHLTKQLERRWQRTVAKLEKLRQPPGHGRPCYRTYTALQKTVQSIVENAGFGEVLQVEVRQEALPRGQSRWVIESYRRDERLWQTYLARQGWRVYVTNATAAQLEAPALVGLYRHQVLHERTFSRLKTRRLNIQPVFLRDEQRSIGLTWLLELALRVLTLTEFRARQALLSTADEIVGLNPAAPSQPTRRPTADRLLAAFGHINLTIVRLAGQTIQYVAPLTTTQRHILALLALPADLYARLAALPP